MDVPVVFGIGVTNGVIICLMGIIFVLIMLIALAITLSNSKEKEKKMIEVSMNQKISSDSKIEKTAGNNKGENVTETVFKSEASVASMKQEKTVTLSEKATVTMQEEETLYMNEDETQALK